MAAVTAAAALAGLSAVLAALLALADRRLRVFEDPRIDRVEEMLPHANCGACGYPGCRPFAEALVAGRAQPSECTVGSDADREAIARYLGVAVGAQERKIARLACAGGANVARNRARYDGERTCAAAAKVAGGPKACFWGCIGYGDCRDACDFDAIVMNEHSLPVVIEANCTACNACVVACPKDLFSLQPVDRRLWVNCRSQGAGDEILTDCEVACTACGRCAADAPGLIEMRDNLPVIDYSREHRTQAPIQRCPTGAIVWLDELGRPTLGRDARRPIRRGPLPDSPT